MREGIIRGLENKLDPLLMKQIKSEYKHQHSESDKEDIDEDEE